MRPSRGPAIMAAISLAVLVGTSAGGSAATSADVPLPLPPVPEVGSPSQVGPQPGSVAAPCRFPPLAPSEIRSMYTTSFNGGYPGGPLPPVVDPGNPCHIYRGIQGLSGDSGAGLPRVMRADITGSGATWNDVYVVPQDSTSLVSAQPTISTVVAPAPGRVVAVTTEGYSVALSPPAPHVVTTQDSGAHWSATDAGLPPAKVAPSGGSYSAANVERALVAVAPSDPNVEILEYPGDDALHLTRDGGLHWALLAFTSANFTVSDIAFDPGDAHHAYVVLNSDYVQNETIQPTPPLILETRDGGNSWRALPPAPLAARGAQSLIVTDRGGGTLYLSELAGDRTTVATVTWLRSRDDGGSWTAVMPPAPGATLAVDPQDASTLVWVGQPSRNQLLVVATTDDFATPPVLAHRFDAPPNLEYGTVGFDGLWDGRGTLSADRAGDFFLNRTLLWAPPGPPGFSDDVIAFRASALASPAFTSSGSASQPGSSTGGGQQSSPPPPPSATQLPPPPPVPAEAQVKTCPLAAVPVPVALGGPINNGSAIQSYVAGSITYDGRYLDYTQEALAPGVIFRIDAATCAPAPSLQLHPEDFPNGQLPVLYELSYAADVRLPDGTISAILAAGPRGDPRLPYDETPVYAIDPVSAHAQLLFGTHAVVDGQGKSRDFSAGDPLFAYDIFRGGLWTMGGGTPAVPGFLPISGRGFQTNCMTAFVDQLSGFGGTQGGVSTWTVTGDGIIYVALEDDKSDYRIDSRTCQVLGGFTHRQISESSSENDSIACDAVTYGPGSPLAPAGDAFSVLWIRDSSPNTVSAYRIPDSYCPFPTRLAYAGPSIASQSQQVQVCFDLTSVSAGQQRPLAKQPVRMTFNQVGIGTATTDANGRACLPAITPSAGGAVQVGANFAGNNAYLPSTAAAILAIPPKPGHVIAGAVIPPSNPGSVPIPQPGPQPNPFPGGEPAANLSAQAEAQAQAQSQAQAQAQSATQAQPGLMMQRQRQTQVAIQQQGTGPQVQTSLQASSLRRSRPVAAQVVAAGLLMAGLAFGRRRPRWVAAKADRRRRRP